MGDERLDEIYPLDGLLPAGTIQIEVSPEIFQELAQLGDVDGGYSEWKTLWLNKKDNDNHALLGNVRFVELSFLAKYRYVRPQWKLFTDGVLHIRIYLIPVDHPANTVTRHLLSKRPQSVAWDARDYLGSLLCCINRAPQAWEHSALPGDQFKPFLSASENITLAEIFSNLPPPEAPPSTFLQNVDPCTTKLYSRLLTRDKPQGMKTRLYKYQTRTVLSMLQREAQSELIPDPSYIQVQGVDNQTFYLQPSSMKVSRGPLPRYPIPSGGILCEEMGTGKTCIILGLIMATKELLAQPEETGWNISDKVLLTELALRAFPGAAFGAARELSSQPLSHGGFPSLREFLIHYIRATRLVLTPEDRQVLECSPHLNECLKNCAPFYRKDVTYRSEGLRTSVRKTPLKRRWQQYYLTTATLIVVPQAIIDQWNSEINKHCDTSILRILYLNDSVKTQSIPPAPKLASDYDIVLLTHERLSYYKEKQVDLIRDTYCQCPAISNRSRVPECGCKQNKCFPLMQVRWKRLVVDEGHKTGSRGNYAQKCQEFNAAHRWIVTGTPTPNLMGLGLGKAGIPQTLNVEDANEDADDHEVNDGLEGEGGSLTPLPDVDTASNLSRPWSKEERTDLNIIGDYVSRFFSFGPYSDRNVFGEQIVRAIMHKRGPLPGSIPILRNIMTLIMFRHPIEIIEKEIPEKLPILQEKIIKLKFQPLAARTYNVLQSLIAINAIDSERDGQDYLFHPSSRKALRTTLQNLSQTLFWKTDPEVFLISGAIQRSREALFKALHRQAPDLDLVHESLRIQMEASKDKIWTEIMSEEDYPFSIRGLSQLLRRSWLKINPDLFGEDDPLLDSPRLLEMQRIQHVSPLISEENLANRAGEQKEREAFWKENLSRTSKEEYRKRNFGNKQGPKPLLQVGEVRSARIPETPLSSVYLHKSASSKANYIVRKVLKHSAQHKFLIFSSMPLSLSYLADTLKLAKVRFLSYESNVIPRDRYANAVTFETNEDCRVLLVELKLGARGLNLISASRIIFCEPVWHGDIESQAIKRAHRIGAKSRTLKVVTLVMEGTYEEAMVSRRRALQNQVQQQASSFELDVNMRRVLEETRFITEEHVERDDSNAINIPLARRTMPVDSENIKVEACVKTEVNETKLEEVENSMPAVKRKRVNWQ